MAAARIEDVIALTEAMAAGTNLRLRIDELGSQPFDGDAPVARSLSSRFDDRPSVLDWIPEAQRAAIIAYASTYDATADIASCMAANAGHQVYFPRGLYRASQIVIPPGTEIEGAGRCDREDKTLPIGTQIYPLVNTTGIAGARWTDYNGSDPTNYRPFVVLGGNGCVLRRLSIVCGPDEDSRLDAGLFVPCVKGWTLDDVSILGIWKDAGIRLDATWSNANTTLTALHPNIISSTGITECQVIGGTIEGVKAVRMQGPAVASAVAAPGGVSDVSFYSVDIRCRGLNSSERATSGAMLWWDAAIPNSAGAAQGHRFFGCDFRGSTNAKHLLYLGYTNRTEFFGCYGEASGTDARIEMLTATGQISFYGGRFINNNIYFDNVDTGSTWDNGNGGIVKLNIARYDGSENMAGLARSNAGNYYPFVDGGISLGTTTRGFGVGYIKSLINSAAAAVIQGLGGVVLKDDATTILTLSAAGGMRADRGISPSTDLGQSLGTSSLSWLQLAAGTVRAYAGQLTLRGNTGITMTGLPTYASNADAITGGVPVGGVYQTATGEVRIRF